MANNYRNQKDRGEGWFDRSNQYDNEHRFRDQEFGSFRQTGSGDNFRDMSEKHDENRKQNSWKSDEDYNRNEGNRYNASDRNSGRNNQENDWNNRYNQWEQKRNDNQRNAQNWGSNTGRDWQNRESWRAEDQNRDRDNDRGWWEKTRDEVSSWFGDDDAQHRRRGDEQREGGYKGKGPKEYQRSSERIREDVYDRLSDSDHVDASEVQVKVENNEVILSGTVSSRQQKRMAEDIVEAVSGVKHVENRIRVRDNENNGGSIFQNTNTEAKGNSERNSDSTEAGTTNEIIRDVTQKKQ